jgi:hypothetical protein
MSQEQNVDKRDDVVIDVARTKLSDLWKKEDYWAIWLGMVILTVGLVLFLPRPPANLQAVIEKANAVMKAESGRAPFKTVAWHQASMDKSKLRATDGPVAVTLKKYLDAPYDWIANPLEALYLNQEDAVSRSAAGTDKLAKAKAAADQALAAALAAEASATQSGFSDADLNKAAEAAISAWLQAADKASKAKRKANVTAYNRFLPLLAMGVGLAILFGIGNKVMGRPFGRFIVGFFQDTQYYRVCRYVRMRGLGGHCDGFGLPGQERRADPCHRTFYGIHGNHDGGHARLHQSRRTA